MTDLDRLDELAAEAEGHNSAFDEPYCVIDEDHMPCGALQDFLAACDPATIRSLVAENKALRDREQRFAEWIAEHVPVGFGDWACAECRPHSDILVDGFRCVVHEARAALHREDGA